MLTRTQACTSMPTHKPNCSRAPPPPLPCSTWLTAELGQEAVAKHMVAVSTNLKLVEEFGIDPDVSRGSKAAPPPLLLTPAVPGSAAAASCSTARCRGSNPACGRQPSAPGCRARADSL